MTDNHQRTIEAIKRVIKFTDHAAGEGVTFLASNLEDGKLDACDIMCELFDSLEMKNVDGPDEVMAKVYEFLAPTAPKVKFLKWRNFEWKGVPESESTNSVTKYTVFFREPAARWGANYVGLDRRENKIGHDYEDCAEAKAAAQTHYTNLILSALEI